MGWHAVRWDVMGWNHAMSRVMSRHVTGPALEWLCFASLALVSFGLVRFGSVCLAFSFALAAVILPGTRRGRFVRLCRRARRQRWWTESNLGVGWGVGRPVRAINGSCPQLGLNLVVSVCCPFCRVGYSAPYGVIVFAARHPDWCYYEQSINDNRRRKKKNSSFF